MTDYNEFLRSKVAVAKPLGVPCNDADISVKLKPHQRDIVRWLVTGGRRACFAAFGLGRFGLGCELSADYFTDSAIYCAAASREASIPTLFDLSAFDGVEAEVPA